MVRYKTEPGEKEQKILAEISLNTPNNLKRRKVTSAVSAVLCVIYAAFAVWMFARGVVGNGFLLLGFAVLFLLIILFSKKFQLSVMQKLMKKRNNAVSGGTLEYVIDDDGVAITSPLGTGNSVYLTIDSELNRVAYEALGGQSGTVGVYNYKTGEILCMVSGPSIDPSSDGDVPDGAYINRCINGSFTPGSIFKLITSAAAIENIKDIDSRRFTCAGSLDVNGVSVKCTGVHGSQTFEDALANSCNCAFAQISLELGADTIESYAKKLGFLDSQSLSGIPTLAGSFTKGASGSANLAWSGIGQYEDLICPYSMLRYVSAIANGGSVVEPSLLLDTPSGSNTNLLSATTANKLRDMMNYNVSAHYGTNRFPGLNLCAKTGTAEVGDGTSHAWFTGFLLDDAHPYAFVVLVENAGGGLTNAGAVANTVLQAAVNK